MPAPNEEAVADGPDATRIKLLERALHAEAASDPPATAHDPPGQTATSVRPSTTAAAGPAPAETTTPPPDGSGEDEDLMHAMWYGDEELDPLQQDFSGQLTAVECEEGKPPGESVSGESGEQAPLVEEGAALEESSPESLAPPSSPSEAEQQGRLKRRKRLIIAISIAAGVIVSAILLYLLFQWGGG